jgi:hypothetical protein
MEERIMRLPYETPLVITTASSGAYDGGYDRGSSSSSGCSEERLGPSDSGN